MQHVGFKIVTDSESFDVILVYRPPRNCIDSYQKLAQLIAGSGPRTFIVGDLNLPTIDWEKGEAQGAGPELVLDACNDKFMDQVVQFETHLRGNCLDLILTNAPDMISEVKNEGRLGASDHYMISAKISAKISKGDSRAMVKNWWKADWQSMKAELAAADWSDLESSTADQAWESVKSKVEGLIDKYVPNKRKGMQGKPPWMSRQLLREVRKKHRMWTREDARNVSAEYKAVEKKVRNMIRNAKRKLEKKLATENGGNSKPFYAYLKSKTKSKSTVGPLLNEQKKIVADKKAWRKC
jgi:hypothetical protein